MIDKKDIDQSKKDVTEMFSNISPMVIEIVDKYAKQLDEIFCRLKNANTFTNDQLREALTELGVEAYMFSMSKDASLLKQECAATLLREAIAMEYSKSTGTLPTRNNTATLKTADKQVVNLLYEAVANMMKSKLDECHRMISVLNSILISRNAEAKLTAGNYALNGMDSVPTGHQSRFPGGEIGM